MSVVRLATSLLLVLALNIADGHGKTIKAPRNIFQVAKYLQPNISPLQDALLKRVADMQEKKDVPLKLPFQWFRKKGLYSSGVRLNFHGSLDLAELRRVLDIYDNNMFVTAWVTSQLVGCSMYDGAPQAPEEQLQLALQAIGDFHDQNTAYKTSVMTFWPQVFNKSVQYYQSSPENLIAAIEMSDKLPMPEIEKLLEIIGLKEFAKQIKDLMNLADGFIGAFLIPPDFDDTFVNLGLGAELYQLRSKFPAAWSLWASQNTNITSVFDALRKYQYRPFSGDPNENSIDPRTYMWIRDFLTDAKKSGKDVALVPTWVQNIEELRTEYYKGVVMPFRTNNVDATVAANTIYGITSAILSGLVEPSVLDDPRIEQIYHNTSALIASALMNNMSDRVDLALTYYPSRIEFYWFVSRTLDIMTTAKMRGPLPRTVMETVFQLFQDTLKTGMTKYVLANAMWGPGGTVYFDDFLGNGDTDLFKKPLNRGEDRIFTTAMAANALLFTWSTYDNHTRTTHWRNDASQEVKEVVFGIINWLSGNVLSDKLKPWNAFFSGSVKNFPSLPFWYPSNQFEYLNGTAIHSNSTQLPKDPFVLALQGYMSPDQYEAELKKTHFGMPTPVDFQGYNLPGSYFPFWSSEPYTYSTALTALARYNSLRG